MKIDTSLVDILPIHWSIRVLILVVVGYITGLHAKRPPPRPVPAHRVAAEDHRLDIRYTVGVDLIVSHVRPRTKHDRRRLGVSARASRPANHHMISLDHHFLCQEYSPRRKLYDRGIARRCTGTPHQRIDRTLQRIRVILPVVGNNAVFRCVYRRLLRHARYSVTLSHTNIAEPRQFLNRLLEPVP
ncbi:MAG: hypothetical protein GF401_10655 [Chitinivibrionales bacterium]|nr:hypothetical protein [Chitinivibrionales bacterium]